MASRAHPPAAQATAAFVSWLVTGAVGPALVALPVNMVADKLADAATRWFRRFRQTDDLSRLVKAAAGSSAQLSRDEIASLRKLLAKESTWSMLAAGPLSEKLAELTAAIASFLSPRAGRTAEGARESAAAIARGLIEFAVFDLQPDIFQRVVLARLQQMTEQATATDQALFRMHIDLYNLVDSARDLFELVRDRLPPGPAGRGEIRIYLMALVNWLSTDPWPGGRGLDGPILTQAAVERPLRVAVTSRPHQDATADADADLLARRCNRLVLLGGPGSGKSWLAKRTARISAENALAATEEGAALEEVELPLYTTFSALIRAPGDIREAAVTSAMNALGDLGGSRISEALRLFFTERRAPTLLVLDSLDEASDLRVARERLRQADTLKQPWRVMLTSRHSSWDETLTSRDGGLQVGELQPLRYPQDVEAVIDRWFADRPERGRGLAAQIARRTSLQQAATVPLMLAFYCILGDRQLPDFKRDLYRQVVNRLLRSPWRPGSEVPADMGACRTALQSWAWQGARSHPVSGIGQWQDDIATTQAQLSPAGQLAVDHVAAPIGDPDYDTDEVVRRFVHRSLREHLVAEHVAGLPVDQAVHELLPHLWYDPDWEYAVPAAIVMHAEPAAVLRALLCRVSRSHQVPRDLPVIDAGGAVRKLLARVAAESGEADWPAELAEIIGQSRVALARRGIFSDWTAATRWPVSDRHVCAALLDRLTAPDSGEDTWWLAQGLAQLDPTSADQHRAREALLHYLGLETEPAIAARMASALAELDPTDDDKQQARERLLELGGGHDSAARLVAGLLSLDAPADDRRAARQLLLQELARASVSGWAIEITGLLAQLGMEPDDRRAVADALVECLVQGPGLEPAKLADLLAQFSPALDERETRLALLDRLARAASPQVTARLVRALARLNPGQADKRRARLVLLNQLAHAGITEADELAGALTQLDPTADDKRRARITVLSRFAHLPDAAPGGWLPDAVLQLDPTPDERRQIRADVLRRLARTPYPFLVEQLAGALARLDPTPDDLAQARRIVVKQLAQPPYPVATNMLAGALTQLGPTPDDLSHARDALLSQLGEVSDGSAAGWLARALTRLDSTPADKHQARHQLLRQLAGSSPQEAQDLAGLLSELGPTPADKAEARHALIRQLAQGPVPDQPDWASVVTSALSKLDPAPDEQRQARDIVLGQLCRATDSYHAHWLAHALIPLDPTVADLGSQRNWKIRPDDALLAAARRNSTLDDWLAALPSLRTPTQ
jgi:hypothetical protein